jgi:hypothetical protein
MSDLLVENQQQVGVVISTPTESSEIYHASMPQTLFAGFGGYDSGTQEGVKSPYSKDAQRVISGIVQHETLGSASRQITPMIQRLKIGETYGGTLPKSGDPIKFASMELNVNTTRSDAIPLY